MGLQSDMVKKEDYRGSSSFFKMFLAKLSSLLEMR